METTNRPTRRRRVAALATAGIMLCGIGLGTNALFTDTEVVDGNTFVAGTLDLAVGDQTETVTAANMAPGDTAEGQVELRNDGTIPLTYTFTVSVAPGDSPELAEALHALTYLSTGTCDAATLDAATPLHTAPGFPTAGETHAYTAQRQLAPGASEVLCLRGLLPLGTPDDYQGDTSTLTWTFNAQQVTEPGSPAADFGVLAGEMAYYYSPAEYDEEEDEFYDPVIGVTWYRPYSTFEQNPDKATDTFVCDTDIEFDYIYQHSTHDLSAYLDSDLPDGFEITCTATVHDTYGQPVASMTRTLSSSNDFFAVDNRPEFGPTPQITGVAYSDGESTMTVTTSAPIIGAGVIYGRIYQGGSELTRGMFQTTDARASYFTAVEFDGVVLNPGAYEVRLEVYYGYGLDQPYRDNAPVTSEPYGLVVS